MLGEELRGSIVLQTRKGSEVDNYFDKSEPLPGMFLQSDDFKRKYLAADHRRGTPSSVYNCHGMTFASRRTGISKSTAVRRILTDDQYERVAKDRVLIGDIVLYVDANGDIAHSGIVVEVLEVGPRVLSKWGSCHEVIHMVGDCPYSASNLEYYRLAK